MSTTDTDLVLSVTDTGVGIYASEQKRIFERFHQVEGIAVPLRPSDAELGRTFPAVVELGAAFVGEALQWDSSAVSTSDDSGSRVLLVEDNADMRDYLVRLLAGQHWSVDAALRQARDKRPHLALAALRQARDKRPHLALAALRQARDKRPHLALSDVMLPGRDGLSLLADLRGPRPGSRAGRAAHRPSRIGVHCGWTAERRAGRPTGTGPRRWCSTDGQPPRVDDSARPRDRRSGG